MTMRKLLTTKEVAKILRRQPDTIAKWRRYEYKGPPWFVVEGVVVYDAERLQVWIEEQDEKTVRNYKKGTKDGE
jgi:hypothetical protein